MAKMIFLKTCLFCLIMTAVPALAEDWVVVVKQPKFTDSIDRKSLTIKKLGDGQPYIIAAQKIEYNEPQNAGDGVEFWTSQMQVFYDCKANKFIIASARRLDRAGNEVFYGQEAITTHSSKDWFPIKHQTLTQSYADFVCGEPNKK